jgi:hypothetical protein
MKLTFSTILMALFLVGCAGTGPSANSSTPTQGALALNETNASAASVEDGEKPVTSSAIPQMAVLSIMLAF